MAPAIPIVQYIQTLQDTWTVEVEGLGDDDRTPDYLHKKLYGPPLQEYIQYKLGWTREQMNDTNWLALKGALLSYPLQGRTTRMKAIYGWLHTHQWKSRIYCTSPTCPFCSDEDTNDHIWSCQATTKNRQDAVATFISSIKNKTPTFMIDIIQHRLEEVLAIPSTNLHPEDMTYEYVESAIASQDDLGWINFIRGRHSNQWEEVYDSTSMGH
jgi:hypothetical protein